MEYVFLANSMEATSFYVLREQLLDPRRQAFDILDDNHPAACHGKKADAPVRRERQSVMTPAKENAGLDQLDKERIIPVDIVDLCKGNGLGIQAHEEIFRVFSQFVYQAGNIKHFGSGLSRYQNRFVVARNILNFRQQFQDDPAVADEHWLVPLQLLRNKLNICHIG